MHVLLISLFSRGGMRHYSAELANALSNFTTVSVITPPYGEVEELYSDRVHEYTVNCGNSQILHLPLIIWKMKKKISSIDPDVVHFSTFGGNYRSLTLAPVIQNTPVISTLHDPVPHSEMEVGVIESIKPTILRFIDRVIVHGENSAKQIDELNYPAENVRIVPHGIYTHFVGKDIIHPEDNILLFFGKIRPNKGYDRIPDIISMVSSELPGIKAIVAGSADVADSISKTEIDCILSKLRSNDRITVCEKYIPNEEVSKFFNQAKIVVLPYYDATQSGVAMTAYAFEKPMVATDTGDMAEMIRSDGTGLLASSESTREIANCIITLLNNQSILDELVSNIQRVKQRYSWKNISKKHLRIYEEVA